jgi:hypothetical protein
MARAAPGWTSGGSAGGLCPHGGMYVGRYGGGVSDHRARRLACDARVLGGFDALPRATQAELADHIYYESEHVWDLTSS